MLSVLIPARNERYLRATVEDVLRQAVGDLEVIAVLDGPPFDVSLPEDSRVRVIRHDQPHGMRPSINEAAAVSSGDLLLKCDAHCAFAPGFDRVLTDSYEDDSWVMVPRRYSLDPVTWTIDHRDPARDYHFIAWPFSGEFKGTLESGPAVLRGRVWHQRAIDRKDLLVDDEMSSQGSCWVMSRTQWERIGPLDTAHYGPFIQEFQEVGFKTWLGGGRVVINKRTWYAHWYKRNGQGYALSPRQSKAGIAYSFDHWWNDRWEQRRHDFAWLVEKFWPLPGWPENWRESRKAEC